MWTEEYSLVVRVRERVMECCISLPRGTRTLSTSRWSLSSGSPEQRSCAVWRAGKPLKETLSFVSETTMWWINRLFFKGNPAELEYWCVSLSATLQIGTVTKLTCLKPGVWSTKPFTTTDITQLFSRQRNLPRTPITFACAVDTLQHKVYIAMRSVVSFSQTSKAQQLRLTRDDAGAFQPSFWKQPSARKPCRKVWSLGTRWRNIVPRRLGLTPEKKHHKDWIPCVRTQVGDPLHSALYKIR